MSHNSEYEVEAVLDERGKGRKKEYLVKWAKFADIYNTWEPVENLKSASELIAEYKKRVEMNKRYARKNRSSAPVTEVKKSSTYQCEVCARFFKSPQGLARHVKACREKSKPSTDRRTKNSSSASLTDMEVLQILTSCSNPMNAGNATVDLLEPMEEVENLTVNLLEPMGEEENLSSSHKPLPERRRSQRPKKRKHEQVGMVDDVEENRSGDCPACLGKHRAHTCNRRKAPLWQVYGEIPTARKSGDPLPPIGDELAEKKGAHEDKTEATGGESANKKESQMKKAAPAEKQESTAKEKVVAPEKRTDVSKEKVATPDEKRAAVEKSRDIEEKKQPSEVLGVGEKTTETKESKDGTQDEFSDDSTQHDLLTASKYNTSKGGAYTEALIELAKDMIYPVEQLIGKRKKTRGLTEYRVKWRGYSEKYSSWEVAENIFSPWIIQAYNERHHPEEYKFDPSIKGKKKRKVSACGDCGSEKSGWGSNRWVGMEKYGRPLCVRCYDKYRKTEKVSHLRVPRSSRYRSKFSRRVTGRSEGSRASCSPGASDSEMELAEAGANMDPSFPLSDTSPEEKNVNQQGGKTSKGKLELKSEALYSTAEKALESLVDAYEDKLARAEKSNEFLRLEYDKSKNETKQLLEALQKISKVMDACVREEIEGVKILDPKGNEIKRQDIRSNEKALEEKKAGPATLPICKVVNGENVYLYLPSPQKTVRLKVQKRKSSSLKVDACVLDKIGDDITWLLMKKVEAESWISAGNAEVTAEDRQDVIELDLLPEKLDMEFRWVRLSFTKNTAHIEDSKQPEQDSGQTDSQISILDLGLCGFESGFEIQPMREIAKVVRAIKTIQSRYRASGSADLSENQLTKSKIANGPEREWPPKYEPLSPLTGLEKDQEDDDPATEDVPGQAQLRELLDHAGSSNNTGSIQITSPVGGEVYDAGSEISISWMNHGNVGTYVSLKLYRTYITPEGIEDELCVSEIAPYVKVTRNRHRGTLPSRQPFRDSKYRVEIASHSNPSICAYSRSFTVKK